jgi:hypothetical protein
VGLLPKRSILSKLHSGKQFDALEEVQEFQLRLAAELEKGTVERIPVGKMLSHSNPEEWYREKDSGVVYRYIPPEFPLKGHWAKVEKPEERSFFEQLYPGDAPKPEEHAVLVRTLDELWLRGEVERARDVDTPLEGVMLYHHPASDETFELTPPGAFTKDAMWRKIFRSEKEGSWPGELKKDVPPARRGA